MNEIHSARRVEGRAVGQAVHSPPPGHGLPASPSPASLAAKAPVRSFLEGAPAPRWAVSRLWNLHSLWPKKNLPRVAGRQAVCQPPREHHWSLLQPGSRAGAWEPATAKSRGLVVPTYTLPSSPACEHMPRGPAHLYGKFGLEAATLGSRFHPLLEPENLAA